MVNLVEDVQRKLMCRLGKKAGLRQLAVDVDDEAGTVISLWAPKDVKKKKKHPVVLLHGFAGDGILTWGFQVGAPAKHHDVYVPDLLHFGGSTSPSGDRSVGFQARCIAAALRKVGVEEACTVVGFSYGGFVAFEMASAGSLLQVRSVVISGATIPYTETTKEAVARSLVRLGAGSLEELQHPESAGQVRSLLSAALHMKMLFPGGLLKDFLKLMSSNRKEKAEMLENLVMCRRDDDGSGEASAAPTPTPTPVFQQQLSILLLWGENDNFFTIEDGKRLKEELDGAAISRKVTLRSISKAGHLLHVERPCVSNRYLNHFLLADDAA